MCRQRRNTYLMRTVRISPLRTTLRNITSPRTQATSNTLTTSCNTRLTRCWAKRQIIRQVQMQPWLTGKWAQWGLSPVSTWSTSQSTVCCTGTTLGKSTMTMRLNCCLEFMGSRSHVPPCSSQSSKLKLSTKTNTVARWKLIQSEISWTNKSTVKLVISWFYLTLWSTPRISTRTKLFSRWWNLNLTTKKSSNSWISTQTCDWKV